MSSINPIAVMTDRDIEKPFNRVVKMNPNVLAVKSKMSPQQLMILQGEVNKHRKSTGTAYLLLIFLSWTGAHQFYLRNKLKGFIYLMSASAPLYMLVSFFAVGIDKSTLNVAAGVLGGCVLVMIFTSLMWIHDLITLSGQTERANDRIEFDALMVMSPESKSA